MIHRRINTSDTTFGTNQSAACCNIGGLVSRQGGARNFSMETTYRLQVGSPFQQRNKVRFLGHLPKESNFLSSNWPYSIILPPNITTLTLLITLP